jgi:hypothetical protein
VVLNVGGAGWWVSVGEGVEGVARFHAWGSPNSPPTRPRRLSAPRPICNGPRPSHAPTKIQQSLLTLDPGLGQQNRRGDTDGLMASAHVHDTPRVVNLLAYQREHGLRFELNLLQAPQCSPVGGSVHSLTDSRRCCSCHQARSFIATERWGDHMETATPIGPGHDGAVA